jgi:hypothetical protein
VSCASTAFCAAVDGHSNATTFNGSSWTKPAHLGTGNPLSAVSCAPSASSCVTVSALDNAFSYRHGSWSGALAIGGHGGLAVATCLTRTFCIALDGNGRELTFNGRRWSAPGPKIGLVAHAELISCPSRSFCAVIDNSGRALTFNGRAWSEPINLHERLPIGALSCVSRSFCVAADNSGQVITYNGRAWAKTELFRGDTVPSVSCASRSFCVAVPGNGGDSDVKIFDGHVWRRSFVGRPNDSGLAAVSCVSDSYCILFDSSGRESTFEGSSWSKLSAVDPHGGLDVSCASRSFCAEDDGSDAVTFNGFRWTAPAPIDPSSTIDSLSCVAGPFCLAIDFHGRALVYHP